MRTSIILTALVATAFGLDSPRMHKSVLAKRAAGPTDPQILTFALFLEYLEADFYALGLSKVSSFFIPSISSTNVQL